MTEKYAPILFGVCHSIGYIKPTINLLKDIPLKGKSAMLEIPEYPIDFPSKDKPWRRDATFYKYWEGVAEYLSKQGAIIIPGNNDYIEREYQKNYLPIAHLITTDLKRYNEEYYAIRENIIEDYILLKDEHFIDIIREKSPDIIMLGNAHSKNLKNIMDCEYIKISRDKKVDDLEKHMSETIWWADIEGILSTYKKELPEYIEGLVF